MGKVQQSLEGSIVKKIAIVFALLVVAVPLSPVLGQSEFPEGLKGIVPEYPGARITFSVTFEGNIQVRQNVDCNPKTALEFYKKAMVEKGWKVKGEMASAEGSMVSLEKGESLLQVTAFSNPDGTSRMVIFLSNE